MTVKRWKLIISGRVQGVSYRASAEAQANELGILGYARNLADGRVEIVAEGNDRQLSELESWCREGSPAATVSSVDAEEQEATGEFTGFGIRR
ncbi:MAG: acylphosphatase [Marinobacter sp.]|uniref:acylphosphatase n=1 Tax=Marinobacter sp. TaxID=50741 RepID=UPI003F96231E